MRKIVRKERRIIKALGLAVLLCGCSGGGGGGSGLAPDTDPPVLTGVRATAGQTHVVVTWQSDELASSAVSYGATTRYEIGDVVSAPLTQTHEIRIDGLTPNTTYYYSVRSKDSSQNESMTAGLSFLTAGAPDTTPPQLSNIQVVAFRDSATITWDTDEPASHVVDFGPTTPYSNRENPAGSGRSHVVQLTGLQPSTLYHFRVTSVDAAQNSASSEDQTFLTTDKTDAVVTEIRQFGIRWTFDRPYRAGQFANGDWWVVGPVKIIKIDPASVSGGRQMHGSMINPPAPGVKQGYDSKMGNTVYTDNVALDVTRARPLVVPPNSSLLSSRSHPTAEHRPQLLDIAILTVLPTPAPPGAFRPPYCGSDKSIRFNRSQLRYSVLARVPKTTNAWQLAAVEQLFERPWPDHIELWMISDFAPKNNMKSYGRDIAADVGVGALTLQLDYSNAQKEKLFVRMVQLGIDSQGVLDDGGNKNWRSGGGYGHGRKFPILLAGVALNDSHMSSVGSQKDVWFGEDQSTFFVEETSPGVFNFGYGGYESKHKDMPEWGSRHRWEPQGDNVQWDLNPYRTCCTANSWLGFVLAARMMKLQTLWNHDALFAYQDRYIQTSLELNAKSWQLAWESWSYEMWAAYRSKY